MDNLERPKRHSCRNNKYGAHQKNLNEDTPLSAGRDLCEYSQGFPGYGALNDSGENIIWLLCCLVRLTGSGLEHEGRLEVLYNGVWGTVCADDFSDVDAAVFCNQLGYG